MASASEKLKDRPSDRAQRQLDVLRAALEDRLVALEAALADPTGGESLERLILDLARSVTEEARSAASKACVDTKQEADKQIAQSRAAEQDAVKAEQDAVKRERTLASELSRAVEQAQQQVARLEKEKQAELRAVREALGADLARERATSAGLERAASDARTQVAEAQRELEAERQSAVELRQDVEREGEVSASLTREIAQLSAMREELTADLVREREGTADLERAHAQAAAQTQAQLEAEQASRAELGHAAERAVELSTTLARENAQALAAHEKIEAELARVESELAR